MSPRQQREVAKQLCILVLKYSVVVSTLTIVIFCVLALAYRQQMPILDYVIEMGPAWFLAILFSSYYLSFCRLHRMLLLYTFSANMIFNRYVWIGIVNIRPYLYIYMAFGAILLVNVAMKIIRKKGRASTGSSAQLLQGHQSL